ncbi:MAG: DUF3782 domain-containing protein [Candidatus Methylumidiphilus alinenensis]|uniref:DUF3782 domain-containing protein n=1 Tax=Candidatus Methylumidiphilus alinenensis TaxID=2202197 RepID=A0A2W4R8Z7_9GAMM|nr:MAG: DUF3782 domain-containing protein [Candidatus Methylumidiphilus alinenensis]
MSTAKEEVWEILRKLALSSEETDRRMQKTDLQMKETDRRMQETDRRMQETDLQMKETDRKLKEVTKAIGRLGNRLGEFVEEMVRPAVVRLFQQRGIAVHQVFRGAYAERDGDAMEIDLLVVNSVDVVLVEVKSELKVDDVKEHMLRLERFKKLFPQYANFHVMGAVAGMVVAEETARFAYRQGLFVLAQSGDTVVIRNDAGFKPVVW